MLVHGTKDLHVPFSQTEELYKKLSEFGHDAVFYQVENGGHSSVFTSEILDIGIAFAKDASQRR